MALAKFYGPGSESVIFVDFQRQAPDLDLESGPQTLQEQLENLRHGARGSDLADPIGLQFTLRAPEEALFQGDSPSLRSLETCMRLFSTSMPNGLRLLSHEEIDSVIEAMQRKLDLSPNCKLEFETDPESGGIIQSLSDNTEEIRGHVVVCSLKGITARAAFQIPFPFPPDHEYILAGIAVRPKETPSLADILLRLLANHPHQRLLFMEDLSKGNDFIVGTATESEGGPFYLYLIKGLGLPGTPTIKALAVSQSG